MPRKAILVVIDGLTPQVFEAAVESGSAPALAALAAAGAYRRAVSTFPSLTPVCLSSIATGAHGDIHEIPHLVWYDAGEQRLVEYGSSFGAVRAAGIGRTLQDTLVNMNRRHLGARASTLFESLADAGLRTAAVNFTAYRGRTRHHSSLPFLGDVLGPERFLFCGFYWADRTRASAMCSGGSGSSAAPLAAPTAPVPHSRSSTGPRGRSMPTPRRSDAGS